VSRMPLQNFRAPKFLAWGCARVDGSAEVQAPAATLTPGYARDP
jgi:hypothetical protein